jgi:hypothetical protein
MEVGKGMVRSHGRTTGTPCLQSLQCSLQWSKPRGGSRRGDTSLNWIVVYVLAWGMRELKGGRTEGTEG